MNVLWVLNTMPPMVATQLHKEGSNKEGWISGLAESVLMNSRENDIKLAVCFPQKALDVGRRMDLRVQTGQEEYDLTAYGFAEDSARAECYDSQTEESLRQILNDFKPDMIHCFGTEYSHTLAVLKVCEKPERVLLGIQGLCFAIAEAYMADLPEKVRNRSTFRDFIKKDNILAQQLKFAKRGEREKEVLSLGVHVTGRTAWDEKMVKAVNPKLHYHAMNETLRREFYTGKWEEAETIPHSVFISQGDYPLKGLHYLLQAMPTVLKEFPDAHIYVAGQSIIEQKNLKDKLKISSYGKYLLTLIKQNGLQQKVTFSGKLTACQMKEQYLKSSLFVCTSALENSPNSLGEAMLLGVPCVAANVGGIPSMFSPQDGILYEAGNVEKLAEAVHTMWTDAQKRQQFTASARIHALCNHDAETNYHRLMEIYGEMMQK